MDPDAAQPGFFLCFRKGFEYKAEDLEELEPDENDDPETGIIYKEYLDRHEVAKDFRKNYTEIWAPRPKDLLDHKDFGLT